MENLHWETYIKNPDGFIQFMEKAVSFLHIYFGDVREAVAHSDQISRFGKVIYNEAAWDTSKFETLKDEITCANHYDTVKEVVLRIEKYSCRKVDMGFVGRWKNPYQIADTHMPTGITISFEMQPGDLIAMRGTLFKPQNWFDLQCKPLFKTDALVEKEPNGSWNMNQAGLISAKNEKVSANRRALFNMLAAFLKEYSPLFMGLARTGIYYSEANNTAYLEDPEAKTSAVLLPLVYTFLDSGSILHSDSTPIDESHLGATTVQEYRVKFDKKHFDYL